MLFLWCTFPNLKEGLSVIEAWGFDYRTLGFSWVKLNKNNGKPFFGIGYYTKSNCEVCLIGVKGKPIVESKKVSSVILHKMLDESDRVHSWKPDTVRDKIVELCGDVPRIELFARQQSDGWDSWGNEIWVIFILTEVGYVIAKNVTTMKRLLLHIFNLNVNVVIYMEIIIMSIWKLNNCPTCEGKKSKSPISCMMCFR